MLTEMHTNENQKPFVNLLLEGVAKRHDLDLHLRNHHIANVGYLNLSFLYSLIKDAQYKNEHDRQIAKFLTDTIMEFLPSDSGHSVYFPNFRPQNHFAVGEEVYVMVADFSSGKQGDYKELGFIKTVIEHKKIDSPFLKLKTFDDLPDGHHLSVGNSSGHTSNNAGRILKINELEALQDRNKTSLEFLDLFRANSVGQFQNLELYDVSKHTKVKKVDNTYSHNEM